MNLRLAIHGESGGFTKKWIEYCDTHSIDYVILNGYDSDIISQLKGLDGFLWHFDQESITDRLMVLNVLFSAEHMGLVVFPNFKTSWHYDDKLAQKYLLEAIDAPMAEYYSFFTEQAALDWLQQATFPVVSKLRRGAGSHNVKLWKKYSGAKKYCHQMFGKGLPPIPKYFSDLASKFRKSKTSSMALYAGKLKRMPGIMKKKMHYRQWTPMERGYTLFQRFVPDNTSDTRITVVGNRAWGFMRYVRKNDFRASGSGFISYDRDLVDLDCVRIAFRAAEALGSQSMAFDFVRDRDGRHYIVEISFGYVSAAVHNTTGYWDRDLNWHEGHMWPEHAHLEDLIAEIKRKKSIASDC